MLPQPTTPSSAKPSSKSSKRSKSAKIGSASTGQKTPPILKMQPPKPPRRQSDSSIMPAGQVLCHVFVSIVTLTSSSTYKKQALAPYVTQCVGIDLTEGMVKEYNTSARNQGIPESEMVAYQGNLISPDDPSPPSLSGPEFFNFDIAVVGLGFHHFDNPGLAAKGLAERLKKGGVLMIVDFLPHEHFQSVIHFAMFVMGL